MRKLSLITIILLIKILLPSSAHAQGANMYDPIYAGTYGGTSAVNYTDTRNNDPANGYGDDFGQPSDDIYYQIVLTAPTQITVSTCGSNFDTFLHILNSDGSEHASNDDDFSAHCGSYSLESYIQITLPAGTYYVVTEGFGYNYGDITVNISAPANAAANAPPGANKDNAIDIGTLNSCSSFYTDTKNNSPANGYGNDMGQASDDIYYKFTLTTSTQVTLSTCGSGFDTYLHLLYGDGVTERAYNDDDGGVHCGGYYYESYIQTTLSAGTYYAVTEGYSTSTGNIVFNLTTGGGVAVSQNMNYVLTQTPKMSITNVPTLQSLASDKNKVATGIQYFDGLGRPLQSVQRQGSPNGSDLVQPMAYDQFGREPFKYLPYASPDCADGSYKPNAIAQQAVFYNPAGSTGTQQYNNGIARIETPYAGTNFEPSPLNRAVEQGAPGNSWQLSTSGVSGAGHTIQTAYGTNTGSNEVILWQVNSNGNGAAWSTWYTPGALYKTTTTDENGHNSFEYKDKQGHVVCKMAQSGSNYLSTYYVYDDYDNLTYVIPPIPVSTAFPTYPTTFTEQDQVFNYYIYGYHYDARNRLIEKKIPGKGDWDYVIYNNLDQVVATQDPVQRGNHQWLFTKYDGLGREIETGIWDNGGTPISRVTLQGQISAQTGNLWESRTPGNYYTTTSCWPNNWTSTLTINYYDDYTFPNNPYGPWDPGTLANPTGLLTGTKTTVLNSDGSYGDQLWTVNFYNDKGRIAQVSKQHYLGGHNSYTTGNYDVIKTAYNFDNSLFTNSRWHIVNNAIALNVDNVYYYDHMGRRIQNYEAINSQQTILVSQVDYNEIGQIKVKHLHNVNGQSGFLQDIAYRYNERGWLSQINDPGNPVVPQQLFSLQLNYDHTQFGALSQYNGNIAEQEYNAGISGLQHVTYNYDDLNRLIDGTSFAGLSEKNITYDNVGNIGFMNRTGPNTASLSYHYTGNQLQTVTDGSNTVRSYGYDPNGNATSDGMGNTMYYNLLNLPRSVPSKNLSYTYAASGEKLNKIANGVTTEYIDGIQYTSTNIDFVQTEEGKANNNNGTFTYEYTLKDHLGNNRVTFDQTNGKVGEDDYYPFGLNVHRQQNAGNKYLYNGKEIQDELNGQYDYGARFYDPVIGRWISVDPLAEDYNHLTPYNYVENNPILMIDPDGMGSDTTKKVTPPPPAPKKLKEVTITAKKDNKAGIGVILLSAAESVPKPLLVFDSFVQEIPIVDALADVVTAGFIIYDLTKDRTIKAIVPKGKVTRVSDNEIKKAKSNGFDPHEHKPQQGNTGGKIDIWKDVDGNLFFRTENGTHYEPLYENINNYLK